MSKPAMPIITLVLCAAIHLTVLGCGLTALAQQRDAPSSANKRIAVPVVVTDATGHYISDLQQNDFEIVDDGAKQRVALSRAVNEPTSVVLLLDTSVSTQEKLGAIRRAAQVFVDQLQPTDRIKVVTFDDQVRELSEFSADRGAVKKAILSVQPGYSTKFYDGMNVALQSLREVDGSKVIVIFSDGVDYRSDYASAESTLRSIEEDAVVVYPIRFSTRVAAEKLAREQAGAPLPSSEIVRSTGGKPERVPDGDPIPSSEPKTGPLGLPLPEEILRRRRDPRGNRDRLPPPERPPAGEIGVDLPTGRSDPRVSSRGREKKEPSEDPIKVMLDRLYTSADTYLQTIADKSGGQVLRADEVTSLPAAFSQVAAELRAQYLLSFDSSNSNRDQYHVIKVTTARPGLIIRARAGYR